MRLRAIVLAVCVTAVLPAARCGLHPLEAAEPPVDAAVDEGLLEFLGSVDSDDQDWHQYLAAHADGAAHGDPARSDPRTDPAHPASPPDAEHPPDAGGAAHDVSPR